MNVREHCQYRWTRASVPGKGRCDARRSLSRCSGVIVAICSIGACQCPNITSEGTVEPPQACSFGLSQIHDIEAPSPYTQTTRCLFSPPKDLPSSGILDLRNMARSYNGSLSSSGCRLHAQPFHHFFGGSGLGSGGNGSFGGGPG